MSNFRTFLINLVSKPYPNPEGSAKRDISPKTVIFIKNSDFRQFSEKPRGLDRGFGNFVRNVTLVTPPDTTDRTLLTGLAKPLSNPRGKVQN